MKIVVVGTSNSVQRDGYTSFLKDHPSVSRLDNLSLGVSTSHLCGMNLSLETLAHADLVILDFAVNEEVYGQLLPAVQDDMSNAIRFAIATILEAGGIPLLLILPRKSVVSSRSVARRRMRHLSEQLSIPMIDGYELAQVSMERNNIPRDAFFRDEAHISTWFAKVIAEKIIVGAQKCLNTNYSEHCCAWEYNPLSYVTLVDVSTSTMQVEYRSSLRSERFIALHEENSVSIVLPPGVNVIGASVNLPGCSGVAHFRGETEAFINLNSQYASLNFKSRTPFLMSVLPFQRHPRADSSNNITVRATRSPATPKSARGEGFHALLEMEKPEERGIIEIGGLILKSDGLAVSNLRVSRHVVDAFSCDLSSWQAL